MAQTKTEGIHATFQVVVAQPHVTPHRPMPRTVYGSAASESVDDVDVQAVDGLDLEIAQALATVKRRKVLEQRTSFRDPEWHSDGQLKRMIQNLMS